MGNCVPHLKGSTPETGKPRKCNRRSGNVQSITSQEHWAEKISEADRDGKSVVVNFSASWCNPCKKVAPLYVELSCKYPSITFLSIDVDELPELSSSWDIRATPTFFFIKGGKEVDKLVGSNKLELQSKISSFAQSVE